MAGCRQIRLDERRQVLNHRLPTKPLGNRAPLEAFPDAVWGGRPYRPEWEADLLSLQRVYRYLATGHWFRRIGDNGHFTIGGHMNYIGNHFAKREVEITFDPVQAAFICQPQGHDKPVTMPAKVLTKADLMGDPAEMLELPTYQLALPFTVKDRQRLELAKCLAYTTFPYFA